MTDRFDAVVIGSGTAGQTAAFELNNQGLSVALVEHSARPGGTCALSGCQAKKWFYEGAELVAKSRHLVDKGIVRPAVGNWAAVLREKNRFTEKVPGNTVAGLSSAGIEFIEGRARFRRDQRLMAGERILEAGYTVIATGAVPMELPFQGSEHLITSSDFLQRDTLPARIVFVGGGFISFEFAHYAARLGPENTHCTILEAAGRPLGPFDEEMVALLVDASSDQGISVECNVVISEIGKSNGGFHVLTEDGRRFEADLVVHGAGRSANIDDLGLQHVGIEHSQKGIAVDERMQTTHPDIYAVGDCAASVQLARVADFEAQVAAADILARHRQTGASVPIDYSAVPSVLFSYPQYGMVGRTESALQQNGIAFHKNFDQGLSWPTYRRVGLRSAAFKILVAEDGQILGAHILSDNATGLLAVFSLAMANGIPAATLHRQTVMSPYPSRESDITYMLGPFANGGD